MSEADETPKADVDVSLTEAEAQVAKGREKVAELDERLAKLEKEVLPDRPEPEHVDQAIGT
jgi:uncharacterized coiled-coil protein SlyX